MTQEFMQSFAAHMRGITIGFLAGVLYVLYVYPWLEKKFRR